MRELPIGIFDSGIGGLTVLKEIRKLLPKENLIYLGDTARVPYGTRSRDTIQKFSLQNADFLVSKDIKALVIACNTASAYAYELLKDKLDIPVFDVISGTVDEAVKMSISKNITVIGTRGTISSEKYQAYIQKLCSSCRVIARACPLFVPLIEEGETKGDLIEITAAKYLGDIRGKQDVIILGCTHYPLIKSVIKKQVGKDTKLIDSGIVTAQKLKEYLKKNELESEINKGGSEYYLTDLAPGFRKTAEIFLRSKLESINKVELQ